MDQPCQTTECDLSLSLPINSICWRNTGTPDRCQIIVELLYVKLCSTIIKLWCTLWWTIIAMENAHLYWIFPWKMVDLSSAFCMFTRGYVKVPCFIVKMKRWIMFDPSLPCADPGTSPERSQRSVAAAQVSLGDRNGDGTGGALGVQISWWEWL